MKKTHKLLITILLILSTMISCIIPASASGLENGSATATAVQPRLTNCNAFVIGFLVADPGEAHVDVSYNAYPDVFTQAKISVKIQKRFLWVFWNTVDIGETNDEWVVYSNNVEDDFYKIFDVSDSGTGTYRAVFTLEFYGTTGVTDKIEQTIECEYN